jgi:hypothetical protein
MPQTIQQALQQANFYSDQQPYHLIMLPPGAVMAAAGVVAEIGEPFCGLIVDKDEVTLLIPQEAWADFQRRLPGAVVSPIVYRLITVDVELEPTLVGFMAHISKALADVSVSILAFAAYSRDHFFVSESQFDLALSTFEKLKSQA